MLSGESLWSGCSRRCLHTTSASFRTSCGSTGPRGGTTRGPGLRRQRASDPARWLVRHRVIKSFLLGPSFGIQTGARSIGRFQIIVPTHHSGVSLVKDEDRRTHEREASLPRHPRLDSSRKATTADATSTRCQERNGEGQSASRARWRSRHWQAVGRRLAGAKNCPHKAN